MRCHFVDMIAVFGNDPSLLAPTRIHPNPTGSAKTASAIWSWMQEACIGQPNGSGCCAGREFPAIDPHGSSQIHIS